MAEYVGAVVNILLEIRWRGVYQGTERRIIERNEDFKTQFRRKALDWGQGVILKAGAVEKLRSAGADFGEETTGAFHGVKCQCKYSAVRDMPRLTDAVEVTLRDGQKIARTC